MQIEKQTVAAIAAKRILVVDDEAVMAEAIRAILRAEGHEVEAVGDGQTALTKFEADRHDLVITDFRMAKMDGLELARAIRALSAAQRIIVITGDVGSIPGSQAESRDFNVLLAKPFSGAKLHEAVASLWQYGERDQQQPSLREAIGPSGAFSDAVPGLGG